jgi:hypothetical protein
VCTACKCCTDARVPGGGVHVEQASNTGGKVAPIVHMSVSYVLTCRAYGSFCAPPRAVCVCRVRACNTGSTSLLSLVLRSARRVPSMLTLGQPCLPTHTLLRHSHRCHTHTELISHQFTLRRRTTTFHLVYFTHATQPRLACCDVRLLVPSI